MSSLELTIKQIAKSLGFSLTGITSAERFERDESAALERVEQGLMDGLPWYTADRVRKANDPDALLPGAKSVISLAMSYNVDVTRADGDSGRGRVAMYALGEDYHNLIKSRLKEFVANLSQQVGASARFRSFVDDGPMNDRAAAERSGLGWFGKNTNILTPRYGSWVFLAQVVTDLDLTPDQPLRKTCGNCVRCIDSCPTGAIIAPYVLDNRKCISFLTIELRGPIPRDLRPMMGTWVFGCDICQDVCPVNFKAEGATENAFRPSTDIAAPVLSEILELNEDQFREKFRNSPVKRAKVFGLQRNACVALGNIGDCSAVPALTRALLSRYGVVRGHAAWALGRIGGQEAIDALTQARQIEGDDSVVEEIDLALIDAAQQKAVKHMSAD